MSMSRSVLAAGLFVWGSVANAHEFWISPEAYVIPNGSEVQAQLRVGQEFSGAGYSFNPRNFTRFELVQGDTVTPVEGRIGDTPALGMEAPDEGLLVVVHETTANSLSYTDMEKFRKFAVHKDFEWVMDTHTERGLSTNKFYERYHRYAKSLISVGNGTGADRNMGLKTEIVALANPYTDALDTLPVQVLLDGAPRADAQIEVFERAPDDTVKITLHRTDAEGRGDVPVKPGHEYLVDAVALLPLEPGDGPSDPVWWSLWASLTFKMPD